jgi:hypothetical protein
MAQETIYEVAERLVRENHDFKLVGYTEYQNGRFNGIIEGIEWQQEQSKQMEKMQLYNFIDFINERHFNSFRISKDEVEQYYNKTFKQQEQ